MTEYTPVKVVRWNVLYLMLTIARTQGDLLLISDKQYAQLHGDITLICNTSDSVTSAEFKRDTNNVGKCTIFNCETENREKFDVNKTTTPVVYNIFTLTVKDFDETDEGLYTCVNSDNKSQYSEIYITYAASAQTKPVITPSGVVPVVQGSNLTLTCFIESNVTTINYQWCFKNRAAAYFCFSAIDQDGCVQIYADGSLHGIQCLGNKLFNLTIYNIQNSADGKYWKCNHVVGNTSTNSEPIKLDMQEGIDYVSLSPSTTLYRVIEGEQLEAITCLATCIPACTYTWSTSGKTVSATGTLDLGQAERRDAGTYMCTVQNTISRFSKNGPVVSLDVIYGPNNVSLSPSTTTYSLREGEQLDVITCAATCNPACSYSWSRSGDSVSSTATLFLGQIERRESGTYICTGRNPESSVTKDGLVVSVHVLHGPDKVTLSPSTTLYRVAEGNNLAAITCYATCNPACTYTWSKSGSRVSSTALLYLRQIERRQAGSYICTVLNTESSISKNGPDVRVDVIYGPDNVSISPATTSYTVKEGDDLMVITCSATCYPACTYTWSRSGLTVSSTATLVLSEIERSEAGSYICTARNPDSSVSKNGSVVRVYVTYGPTSLMLNPSTLRYIKNEGDKLGRITCSADCFPECNILWRKTSGVSYVVSNNAYLSIGKLDRTERGTYRCEAINRYTRLKTTNTVTVHVRYGPDDVTLNVPNFHTVTEGNAVNNINCSADCWPRCVFTWSNLANKQLVSSSAVLNFRTARRDDAGDYKCLARNSAYEFSGEAEKHFTLSVQYSPDVFISESSALLNENTPLDLLCKASGVPAVYNYTGFLQRVNGIVIPNNHVESLGVRDSISVNIPYLQLQDTGLYTCFVHNGIIGINKQLIQTASKRVEVQASPKFLLEETNFAGETTENITIAIPFVSIPEYTSYSVIRHDGQPVSTNGKYTLHIRNESVYPLFYGQQIKLTGNVLEIIIRDLSEKDFGMYKIQITNDINTTDFSVDVRALSQPSPPTEMKLNTLDNKVKFEWKEGFNGGHAQTFVLETSPNSGDSWTKRLTIKESEPKYLNENGKIKVNLSNLDPGVYNARLVAFNIIGAIDPVEFKKRFEIMKLNQETLPRDSVGPVIGWTVGGIMAALVALIIIVVMIRRKYTCSNRFAKREDQSQSELRADIQGNANTENNAAQTSEVMAVTRDTGEYTDLKIRSNCPENTHFYMPLDESSSKSDVYYQNVKKEDPVYNNTVLKNSAQTEL